MTIETFIQEFNKRVDWNLEILNKYNINIDNSNSTSGIIKDYLSFTKINPEDYDVDNAELFEYPIENDKQTFELQAYSLTDYCHIYFWVTMGEDEDEYKKNKIDIIKKSITKRANDVESQLETLMTESVELNSVLNKFND